MFNFLFKKNINKNLNIKKVIIVANVLKYCSKLIKVFGVLLLYMLTIKEKLIIILKKIIR